MGIGRINLNVFEETAEMLNKVREANPDARSYDLVIRYLYRFWKENDGK